MENIIEKTDIDSILKFINENFSIKSNTDKLKNIKKLVDYFSSNDIQLSLEDADILLKKSSTLRETIEYADIEGFNDLSLDSVETLFLAKDLSNNIGTSIDNDDTFIPKHEKSNDIDTFKLYLSTMPSLLTEDEEKKLIERISKGDEEARKLLVEHNLRLSVAIAKRYTKPGLSLNDLVQEGNMGLMMAADKYISEYDCKFSTYAVWWIKQKITRYIADNSRTVRIPVYMNDIIYKMNKMKKTLETQLNREITKEELAIALNIPLKKLYQIEKYGADTISLETKVNKGDGEDSAELGNFVEDENAQFEARIIKNLYLNELSDTIFNGEVLNDREKLVLQYRYGFIDGEPKTLEEVGKVFDLTRERVRQIEKNALKKLSQSGTLKEFKPEGKLVKAREKDRNVRGYNFVLKK